MAIQIFGADGNYLAINPDGSINTTTSLSASFDDVETYLSAIEDALDVTNPTVISISGRADQIDAGIQVLETQGYQSYISNAYSRIIQTRSTDTYIAHAPVGSTAGASVWQVQKIDTDGSRSWADGAAFTQVASGELSGLTFAY